jgi:hypothetical protein
MKKITAILGVLAAVASLSFADSGPEASATDTKKIVQNNFVETAQKGVKLSGYVDAGYSYNFTGSANQSQVNSRAVTDSAARGDFNLYAFKIALEKALTSENKAQAGFRADVIIGEDANYLKSRDSSNNTPIGGTPNANTNTDMDSNSLFLEQAYAQFRIPVGNGWDWKVGKFVSILGYEVIERPANMNITYGLLFQNASTFNYTGVLTSYRFDDYLDAKLGVANGANSDNNTTVNNNGDAVTVLASLNVTAPGGNANWSNNFTYETGAANNTSVSLTGSSYPVAGQTNPSGPSYIYNSWGNWAPKFADDKLLFAFDSFLGAYSPGNGPAGGATTWWGAGLYSKYQFNDWFYLAGRGEYFGSDNQNKTGISTVGSAQTNGVNSPANGSVGWWAYTITAGFNVIDNLLIRAEYRLDWGTNISGGSAPSTNTTTGVTTAGTSGSGGPAHYAGAEVVYSF